MRLRLQGSQLNVAIRLELQQQDRTVTGTWLITTAGNDGRGEIRGTLEGVGSDTTFRGTATWISDTQSGTGRCTGTAMLTGPAVPPSVAWTSPQGWDFGVSCQNAITEVMWSVIRG